VIFTMHIYYIDLNCNGRLLETIVAADCCTTYSPFRSVLKWTLILIYQILIFSELLLLVLRVVKSYSWMSWLGIVVIAASSIWAEIRSHAFYLFMKSPKLSFLVHYLLLGWWIWIHCIQRNCRCRECKFVWCRIFSRVWLHA